MTKKSKTAGMTIKMMKPGSVYPGFEKEIMKAAKEQQIEDVCPCCDEDGSSDVQCLFCDGLGKVLIPARHILRGEGESEEDSVRSKIGAAKSDVFLRYTWYRKLLMVMMEKPEGAELMLMGNDLIAIPSQYSDSDPLDPEDCTMVLKNSIKYISRGVSVEVEGVSNEEVSAPSDQ